MEEHQRPLLKIRCGLASESRPIAFSLQRLDAGRSQLPPDEHRVINPMLIDPHGGADGLEPAASRVTGRRLIPESFPNGGRWFVDRSERREATKCNESVYAELRLSTWLSVLRDPATERSKSKLQSCLHEARRHCANDLAERGIVDVAIDRVCAEKLCVIEGVESLKAKFEGFGFGQSRIF